MISTYEFLDEKCMALVHGALQPQDCKDLIEKFENFEHKEAGKILIGEDLNLKKSTDLCISHPKFLQVFPEWVPTYKFMHDKCRVHLREIQLHWPSLTDYYVGRDTGYRIQRYDAPGEGYDWHNDQIPIALVDADKERKDGNKPDLSPRMLTCVWYLNDNFEGGTTDFQYQNLSIQPEVGMLAVFPPFWTHIHRAAPVTKGSKYMIVNQCIEGYQPVTI